MAAAVKFRIHRSKYEAWLCLSYKTCLRLVSCEHNTNVLLVQVQVLAIFRLALSPTSWIPILHWSPLLASIKERGLSSWRRTNNTMTNLPCLSDSRVDCYSTINKLWSRSGCHTGTKVWGRAENRAPLGSLTERSGHRARYLQDKIKLSIGLNISKLPSLNTTSTPTSKRVLQSVSNLVIG